LGCTGCPVYKANDVVGFPARVHEGPTNNLILDAARGAEDGRQEADIVGIISTFRAQSLLFRPGGFCSGLFDVVRTCNGEKGGEKRERAPMVTRERLLEGRKIPKRRED
jgi:hypothetical protein